MDAPFQVREQQRATGVFWAGLSLLPLLSLQLLLSQLCTPAKECVTPMSPFAASSSHSLAIPVPPEAAPACQQQINPTLRELCFQLCPHTRVHAQCLLLPWQRAPVLTDHSQLVLQGHGTVTWLGTKPRSGLRGDLSSSLLLCTVSPHSHPSLSPSPLSPIPNSRMFGVGSHPPPER